MRRYITPAELERLRRGALRDARGERAFFRALLDATLFAHAPVSDDSGRLRLIQFERPDGLTVLPLFTERHRAQRASGPAVRIVELTGRLVLEATLGETIMLDPNDESCTLYPEEIAALLEHETLPAVLSFTTGCPIPMALMGPSEAPSWLISVLTAAYVCLPFVESAFLLQRLTPDVDGAFLMVIVGCAAVHAERVIRVSATAMGERPDEWAAPIDVSTFDPAAGVPDVLAGSFEKAFYRTGEAAPAHETWP